MRTPTFEKKSHTQFCFLLFRLFLSEILSRRCRFSRTTSDPAQKSGKNQAKIAFFLIFFRRKFWYDFVTPFSTFANIKRSCSKISKKTPGQNCVFLVFPAKKLARFCHADLDFREHQGLPPDLFDHARSIAMADQNRQ